MSVWDKCVGIIFPGSFDANDDDIGTGIAGAPACGDVMKLQVECSC